MSATDTYVTFDTPVLNLINEQSRDKGYERTLSPAILRRIDPQGHHVCAFNFMPDDDRVRMTLAIKLVDREAPATATLDVAIDTFRALPRTGWDDDGNVITISADGVTKKVKK